MPAVALTDFNNFFAAVKFYKATQGSGVKPILGTDLLVLDESGEGSPTQLVLLVKDQTGYANLTKLISKATKMVSAKAFRILKNPGSASLVMA